MKRCRTTQLQACLDRHAAGQDDAREELIALACGRLRTLVRDNLRRDRVRRWEQTDDVLQHALHRIHLELAAVQPKSVRDFLRFSAFHIQRELTRLARHYYGPHGWGANYQSDPAIQQSRPGELARAALDDACPQEAVERAEEIELLNEAIVQLPDELREVVELLWTHGMTHREASMATDIHERTVRRRWTMARLQLYRALDRKLSTIEDLG